jgi:hypothetical protein
MEKSIEQHLHATNERGCCSCCYACMQRFDFDLHEAICQSRTPLWAIRDGGGGGMGCFARMG